MIHHYSISVQDTKNVSKVMASLFNGTITGFGPYRDSYIVWFGDDYGSAIELYPAGAEMFPDLGEGPGHFRHNPSHSKYCATHAAISINRSKETIYRIAEEQGWKAIELNRGGFNVIEFWVENRVLIELLTLEMAMDYLSTTKKYLKPN